MSCLQIRNLTVRFGTASGPLKAVDCVSLAHEKEETLALVGETGCGKSMLGRAVLKLLPGDALVSGEILYEGRNLLSLSEKDLPVIRGNEISYVLQNPSLALDPVRTVGKQISEVFHIHRRIKIKDAARKTDLLLQRMGFSTPEEIASLYPFQLSEGMNQRILIAMAVALHPRIIIADEPTKGLDERLKKEVIGELDRIKKEKESSLLLISHDLGVARKLSNRIAIMYCGQIVEVSPAADFFAGPLHPYSRALLESHPENGFNPVPGTAPSMIAPPRGCRFHPRCGRKMDICAEKEPQQYRKKETDVKCFLHR